MQRFTNSTSNTCIAYLRLANNDSMKEARTQVLTAKQIDQRIDRIAYQIYENNYQEEAIIVAGIEGRGSDLAAMICEKLKTIAPIEIISTVIKVDKRNPVDSDPLLGIENEDLKDTVVILVDDVLNSGKTLIYGVKRFLRVPLKRLRTVVLVDRDHKRYPIKADYVGLSLSTTLQEHITVVLSGDEKGVYLD